MAGTEHILVMMMMMCRHGSGCNRGKLISGSLPPRSVPAGHDDMPVVLDSIVGSPGEHASDQSPLVAIHRMSCGQAPLLLLTERPPVYARIQLVEPPQSAALP
jgi:hypothetical protein